MFINRKSAHSIDLAGVSQGQDASEKRPQSRDSLVDCVFPGRGLPPVPIERRPSVLRGPLHSRWCHSFGDWPDHRILGNPAALVYQETGAAYPGSSANRAQIDPFWSCVQLKLSAVNLFHSSLLTCFYRSCPLDARSKHVS